MKERDDNVKSLLRLVLIFLVGLVVGAGGVYFGVPSVVHARAEAAAKVKLQPTPFNPKTAVVVTESNLQSDLADPGHYIDLTLSFQVSEAAFVAAGGNPAAAQSGSGGTGSPLLDAKIDNAVIDVLRSTSYGALSSSGGLAVLKMDISTALQSLFGPGTIGGVYFSNLVTQ